MIKLFSNLKRLQNCDFKCDLYNDLHGRQIRKTVWKSYSLVMFGQSSVSKTFLVRGILFMVKKQFGCTAAPLERFCFSKGDIFNYWRHSGRGPLGQREPKTLRELNSMFVVLMFFLLVAKTLKSWKTFLITNR